MGGEDAVLRALLACLSLLSVCWAAMCPGDSEWFMGGECLPCHACIGGGQFLNTTLPRTWNERDGFTDCYPCETCPDGTYREAGSSFKGCFMCMLDCASLNRFSSQNCGGSNPGHCGDCYAGFKPETLAPQDYCEEDLHYEYEYGEENDTEGHIPEYDYSEEDHGTITDVSTDNSIPIAETETNLTAVDNPTDESGLDRLGITIIIAVSGCVCMAVVYGVYYLINDAKICGDSTDSQWASFSSLRKLLSRYDIETDGPVVRGEMSTFLHASDPLLGIHLFKEYPHHNLGGRAEAFAKSCFSCISTNISGEYVKAFFRELDLQAADYDPDHELFLEKKQSFKDYIYNVLKGWYHKRYETADLHDLCEALDKHGFASTADKLVELHTAEVARCSGNVEYTCISELDLQIEVLKDH